MIRLAISLLAIVSAFLPSYGKSAGSVTGDGHSGDMARVLGVDLDDKDAKSRMAKMASGFAKYIDCNADELYRRIRAIEPTFSWGVEGHRIFFHWGLHGNPRNSDALAEKVRNATGGDLNRSENIWKIIIAEQAVRNKGMFAQVSAAYDNIKGDGRPAPFRHDDISGIAALVYDTHILGDYTCGTEKTQRTLIDLSSVKRDVINAVRSITSGDVDFKDNAMLNRFTRSIRDVCMGTKGEQAQRVLDIMTEQIPPILKSCPRVGKTLKVK